MQIEFPSYLNSDVVDLIQNLLHIDPAKRLGTCKSEATSFDRLKAHPYFANLDFTSSLDAHDEMVNVFDE